jgi:hypothetical protein
VVSRYVKLVNTGGKLVNTGGKQNGKLTTTLMVTLGILL